jgi:hypothetical protein
LTSFKTIGKISQKATIWCLFNPNTLQKSLEPQYQTISNNATAISVSYLKQSRGYVCMAMKEAIFFSQDSSYNMKVETLLI